MYTKEDFPKKYQLLFDYNKKILTEEAFEIWCDNVLNDKRTPYPEPYIRNPKKDFQDTVQQARKAVESYSPSNGARIAVEALADALEQAQTQ